MLIPVTLLLDGSSIKEPASAARARETRRRNSPDAYTPLCATRSKPHRLPDRQHSADTPTNIKGRSRWSTVVWVWCYFENWSPFLPVLPDSTEHHRWLPWHPADKTRCLTTRQPTRPKMGGQSKLYSIVWVCPQPLSTTRSFLGLVARQPTPHTGLPLAWISDSDITRPDGGGLSIWSLVGLDEVGHGQVLDDFLSWCEDAFLKLNVSKTKEIGVDFRKSPPVPLNSVVHGRQVDLVNTYKYLGTMFDSKLKNRWELWNICKKGQQGLLHFRLTNP